MWDITMHVVNMFHYHRLLKKLLCPMPGQDIAGWKIQAERQGQRR